MSVTPIMLLSDAPNGPTGLGRITRELAIRIHSEMADTFRVATIGAGSTGPSPDLPFQQFGVKSAVHYVPENLPDAWRLFSQGQRGVLLVIMNPGWCAALANPELLPDSQLRDFLMDRPFDLWIYAPIDGDTIGGRLPKEIGDVFRGFDRVLAYTAYGASVISKTMGHPNEDMTPPFIEHLPHGIDTSVFYSRDREEARATLFSRVTGLGDNPILDGVFMVGIVATSTARKDWGLAFETCAELKARGVPVGIWVHSNTMQGFWNIPMLAREFGLDDVTIASNHHLSDVDMAWAYSACDVTLGIGSGEGFGIPLAESLACGVPVIHGDYAGGADFVPKDMLIKPLAFRYEGIYGIRRPVFIPSMWADSASFHGNWKRRDPATSMLPGYIDWNNAFPEWSKWLIKGIK